VLVTTGYVFGTMYLAIVLGGLLLEGLIVRDWPGLRRIVLLGVFCSLLAATVYLPGILTSPVTWRDTWIIQGDDGFLQMDPVTLLLTGQPTTVPPSVSYFGVDSAADQPSFIYVAWFLPLLCWVGFTRLRTGWRSLVSLVVPFVLFVTWTLMPYYMGPIRMPGRVMSVVTLTAVLLVVVLLERTLQGRPGRLRVGLSLLWVALAAAGAALLQPHYTALQLGAGAVVLACVVAAAWAAGRGRLLPVVMIVGSVVVAMFQFTFQGTILGGDRGAPGSLAEYSTVLPDTQGDVFVIGLTRRLLDRHPELGRSLPSGSLWDLSGKPVHDGYTTLGFRKYNFRFCVRYNGDVCGNALKRMLAVEPTTGLRWVDLHSISSLVLVRTRHHGPPPGWHVARRDPHVVTWVRDHVVPTAGGVVWTSPGTRVRQVGQSETSATFVVESVGADGGRVVLSRLAWPGYQIHGARIGAPLGGHLLSVRLAPGDVGRTVKVYFRPPGWELEMACLAGALALGSAWSVLVWVRRRRSRPTPPEAGAAAEEPTVPATSP
jgi:hypothetical protein